MSTVGLNEDTVKKYIKEQEKTDIMMDKSSVKEYEAPLGAVGNQLTPSKGAGDESKA